MDASPNSHAIIPADPGTAGNPPAKTVGGFSDVLESAYFAQPVVWAVEQKIANGTGNNQFTPDGTCSRGQIVTFLYRAFAK